LEIRVSGEVQTGEHRDKGSLVCSGKKKVYDDAGKGMLPKVLVLPIQDAGGAVAKGASGKFSAGKGGVGVQNPSVNLTYLIRGGGGVPKQKALVRAQEKGSCPLKFGKGTKKKVGVVAKLREYGGNAQGGGP